MRLHHAYSESVVSPDRLNISADCDLADIVDLNTIPMYSACSLGRPTSSAIAIANWPSLLVAGGVGVLIQPS
jgi:hypothetical protein